MLRQPYVGDIRIKILDVLHSAQFNFNLWSRPTLKEVTSPHHPTSAEDGTHDSQRWSRDPGGVGSDRRLACWHRLPWRRRGYVLFPQLCRSFFSSCSLFCCLHFLVWDGLIYNLHSIAEDIFSFQLVPHSHNCRIPVRIGSWLKRLLLERQVLSLVP